MIDPQTMQLIGMAIQMSQYDQNNALKSRALDLDEQMLRPQMRNMRQDTRSRRLANDYSEATFDNQIARDDITQQIGYMNAAQQASDFSRNNPFQVDAIREQTPDLAPYFAPRYGLQPDRFQEMLGARNAEDFSLSPEEAQDPMNEMLWQYLQQIFAQQ